MIKVGVGVIVRRYNVEILMGLRKGAHGAGKWSFPGGHLEDNETVEEAASRELEEETAISIPWGRFRKLTYTDDDFKAEGKRYITLYVVADLTGTHPYMPRLREPSKCERWEWFRPENVPDNLFLPVHNLLRSVFFGGL